MIRTTQRLVMVLAAAILLAGCTSQVPNPVGETSPVAAPSDVSVSSEPLAVSAESATRPVPTVPTTPAPVKDAAGECSIETLDEGTLDGVDIERVRDRGSRRGATGTVSTASGGTPASYLVSAGDISERIADRFCISADYLAALNSVRRDGVDIESLFGGDTLNLRPTTVLGVGDQNGRVLHNAKPRDLPTQTG
ncbi:hypothetical protein C5E02_12250 [Rathayibacter rathayi]|uniref:LysM domain-containing protein n=1 Tax=Rathayibacter rathayi TaxID=33887 RepID=A0ABD6W8U6_RATRA|nr:hypothetical protein [Rathayibacter rathayi]AZZ49914.1 hypothetical protein C1O28_12590 [Rathayibacter rathayi]MWV75197.1 hypothetical protein [Rathayibacter rathayi NCPPB 2980 = VKM Ac-1601]PPF13973.1 hypothetical protein C5C04_08380 [Rathayibacter rathayi]PPF48673.1 hypothetical protein C5C08_08790 [Rathayibacter rathayi]PPF79474.1 hypothetical protein C5C14_08545 [Rathayibacter rathayi]